MIRTVYGLEALLLIFRAAVCAIRGHDWSLLRKACDRCDLRDEERWRMGACGPAPRMILGEPVEAADAFATARAFGLPLHWPGVR